MTSVSDEAPPIDPDGTSFLLVGVGAESSVGAENSVQDIQDILEDWRLQVGRRGVRAEVCSLPTTGPDDRESLRASLHAFTIGARIMVAGAEADVLTVCSWLRQEGVVPEEITTATVSRDEVSVFCVHCAHTHRRPGGPGSTLTCPLCARELEVHEHSSSHLGSYLASAPTAASPQTSGAR